MNLDGRAFHTKTSPYILCRENLIDAYQNIFCSYTGKGVPLIFWRKASVLVLPFVCPKYVFNDEYELTAFRRLYRVDERMEQ